MRTFRLGDFAEKIGSGKTPLGGSCSYLDRGISLIRSQNVLMRSFTYNGLVFISDGQHSKMAGSEVRPKDVLLNITGASIGRVCVVPDDVCPANVNQHVCIIRTNARIDSDWLSFYLSSPEFQDFIMESQAGGTRQALNMTQIHDFKIPAIGIADQRRIAAHLKVQLAEVEKARKAAEVQVQELRTLKSKTLNTLFSKIQPVCPIGTTVDVQSGYAFKSRSFKPKGIRLLRNTNILPGKVYWDDTVFLGDEDAKAFPNYELHKGDVLISLDRPIISTGLKVARVSQIDLPALLLQRVGRFLVDQELLVPDYLYAFLQTDMFIDAISGHDQSLGVPHVSPSQIEAVEIPLPDIVKQNEVVTLVKEIDLQMKRALQTAEKQLTEINLLPQKILSQAFGGGAGGKRNVD